MMIGTTRDIYEAKTSRTTWRLSDDLWLWLLSDLLGRLSGLLLFRGCGRHLLSTLEGLLRLLPAGMGEVRLEDV